MSTIVRMMSGRSILPESIFSCLWNLLCSSRVNRMYWVGTVSKHLFPVRHRARLQPHCITPWWFLSRRPGAWSRFHLACHQTVPRVLRQLRSLRTDRSGSCHVSRDVSCLIIRQCLDFFFMRFWFIAHSRIWNKNNVSLLKYFIIK